MNARRGSPGSPASLREANLARVLDALRRGGAMTQIEIAGNTGLSPATVSNLVRELDAAGAVNLTPSIRNGRRATLVSLAAQDGLLVGIVVGIREMRVAVASSPGTILRQQRMPLQEAHQADDTLDRAAHMVRDLAEQSGHHTVELMAVGAAVAAPVDSVSGQVGAIDIMRGWHGVDLGGELERRLGIPAFVDNDANLAALGELRHGVLQGEATACYINYSHGVGAGLVLGGEIFRGSAGTAGELGHTTLDEDGAVCRCGNRGCLDTVVGARALLESLRSSHGDLRLRDLLTMAMHGDPGCRRVLEDAGRHLGVAVSNIVNLLNPDVIVLGGDLAPVADLLIPPMRDAVDRCAIPSAAATVAIRRGVLGDEAAIFGALAVAAAVQGEQLASEASAVSSL